MSESREWRVGGTTVRFEPPELVWVHTRGRATSSEAQAPGLITRMRAERFGNVA